MRYCAACALTAGPADGAWASLQIESTVLTPEEEDEIRGSLRNLKERIRDEAKRYRRVKTRHQAEAEAIRRLLVRSRPHQPRACSPNAR